MKIDDSFKKPGSIPFKWEIRPGVPKLQTTHTRSGLDKQKKQRKSPINIHNHPSPETPPKLKPPPAGLFFQPQMERRTQTRSVGSSPRTPSHRFGLPGLARPDVVSSAGCLPSPIGKLKYAKKRGGNPRSATESDYGSDLEISSRWSVSSRKSVSPLPSSFPSNRSSPRPVYDAEWAGFGLF